MGKRILFIDEPDFLGAFIGRLLSERFLVKCVNPGATGLNDTLREVGSGNWDLVILEPALFPNDEDLWTLRKLLVGNKARVLVLSTLRWQLLPLAIKQPWKMAQVTIKTKPIRLREFLRLVRDLVG